MQHDLNAYLEGVEESDRLPLMQAIQFLQDEKREVINSPVSTLQRHLRIGYSQGLRLARYLERLRFWMLHNNVTYGRVAIVQSDKNKWES